MPKWQKASDDLVALFTNAVAPLPGVQTRKMFGYPAAFANGNMFAGIFADDMFVRLPAAEQERLLKVAGAKPFAPMPGRPMREYVVLPVSVRRSSTDLASWLKKALSYAKTLPPKAKKRR